MHVLDGLCVFLALGLAATLVFTLTGMGLPLPGSVRWGMLVVWAAWLLGALVYLVFMRLLRNPTDEQIALLIEAAHPELHNEVINAIRLAQESPDRGGPFVRAAIRESDRKASRLDAKDIVRWRRVRRHAFALGFLAVAWLALLAGFRARTLNALSRMVMPDANLARIGGIAIGEVIPGGVTVIVGDNLVVEAAVDAADGSAPSVRVQHFEADGPLREEKMQPVGEGVFRCELLDIKAPRTYRVAADGSRSRDYHISVADRPLVSKIAVEYRYPGYTGLEPRRDEECAGTVRALKGSSATLEIVSNKSLNAAALNLGMDRRMTLRLEPGHTTATMKQPLLINADLSGQIEIEDEDGCRNSRPIRVVADRDHPPIVKIVAPGADRSLAAGGSLPLAVRGSDDFGVVRAELVEKRVSPTSGEAAEPTVIHEWTDFADARNVALHWTWRLDEKLYRNGEIVRYFVRMVDANDVDGPGIGASAEFVVRVEDVAALQKERQERYRSWQADLEKLLTQQKELRRAAEALETETESEKPDAPQ